MQNKGFIKEFILSNAIGFIIALLNFIFTIIISNRLLPEAFGIFGVANSMIYLLQVPSSSLSNYFAKLQNNFIPETISKIKMYTFVLILLISGISILLLLLNGKYFETLLRMDLQILFILAIGILITGTSAIFRGLLIGSRQVIKVNLIGLVEVVIKLTITFLIISESSKPIIPVIIYFIPAVISLPIYIFLSTRKLQTSVTRKSINFSLKQLIYSYILFSLLFILFNIGYTLDSIIVPLIYRPSYAALTTIGSIIYFGCVLGSSVIYSRLVSTQEVKDKVKLLLSVQGVVLIIGFIGLLFVYIFFDYIQKYMFDGNYGDIKEYLFIYGISMVLFANSYIVINALAADSRYYAIIILLFIPIIQFILISYNNTSLGNIILSQSFILSLYFISLNIFYYADKTHLNNQSFLLKDRNTTLSNT